MSLSSPSRKRTAEDTAPQPTSSTPSAPLILARKHHRRRNIAIDTWGLDGPNAPNAPPSRTASSSSSSAQPFNIYKSLLRHSSLFPHFLIALPLDSAVALYSIDKELHYLFNLYSLSLIHLYAHHHFPVSSCVFSAALHPGLCISDPMLRPMDGRYWLARDVPGWRWVGMVSAREGVVKGILTALGCAGVGDLEYGVEEAVFKLWSLMDMPSTPVRMAYLQDKEIWSDANIADFWRFLVKLDMRFAHPVTGNGGCGMAHLLLTQHSLSMLHDVLIGKIKLDYDKTGALVRRTYWSEDLDTETYEWLLDAEDAMVPELFWGIMMREGREPYGERMESVVDMVIAEGVRRELHLQGRLLEFVVGGHVDGDGRNLARRGERGRGKKVEMKGWPSKVERDEAIANLDKKLGLVDIKVSEDKNGDEMDLGQ